jgi:hypothetical protein
MAATGALLLCLRALYRIAGALMRPSVETVLEQEALVGVASHRHLREEKRRLVRAINELTFDHEMGKLSEADYASVRDLYQLQAVEVMRALQDDRDLHPGLLDELRRLGVADLETPDPAAKEPEPEAASEPEATPEPEPEAKAEPEAKEPEPEAKEPEPEAKEPEPEEKAELDAERSTRVCPKCSTPNDPDARFCKSCGVGLEEDG